jgi:hypothetical protein
VWLLQRFIHPSVGYCEINFFKGAFYANRALIMEKKKKIIVVGGGFAGIQLIRSLEKSDFDILLIDKVNHHQFQPLF